MKIITGLGNPGKEYQNSRHNFGFMVLEQIAKLKGITFNMQPEFESKIADLDIDGKAKLVMPETFMNESGRAVSKIKNYFKVISEEVWVISDDVDLELGKIKINFGGSSAGHKGVQSIIDNIGEGFWRIRTGIGKDEKIPTEKWVLEKFTKNESEMIDKIIDRAANLVVESLSSNLKQETIII